MQIIPDIPIEVIFQFSFLKVETVFLWKIINLEDHLCYDADERRHLIVRNSYLLIPVGQNRKDSIMGIADHSSQAA